MASNERRLQTRGVDWLKLALPQVMVIAVINEIPQAGAQSDEARKANMIRMMLMKQMGLYPGCSDLILLWNDGNLQIRFLETKDKAPQSVSQKKFEDRIRRLGGVYNIWRSLGELYELCLSWGLKPLCAPPGWVPETKKQLLQNMYHQVMMDLLPKPPKE